MSVMIERHFTDLPVYLDIYHLPYMEHYCTETVDSLTIHRGVRVRCEGQEIFANIGEHSYDIGNKDDTDDLLNQSPKKSDTFDYPSVKDSIPKTVPEDINGTLDEDLPVSTSNIIISGSQPRHSGCKRLWEFLRDLLRNQHYNPSHIKWINQQNGEFKIIKTTVIAQMWGEIKNNDGMTYEKMSRAMRYYYKRQILAPVLNKRLVYKFGPKSYGWQSK